MKKTIIGLCAVLLITASAAFGTTYTNIIGSATSLPADGRGKVYVIENTLDFDDVPVANTDVVQVLGVPSNCIVLAVSYQITTASAETTTFDIGDGDGATQYKSNAAAQTVASAVSAAEAWKFYTANDTIDITADGTITNGVVTVSAAVMDVSARPSAP